MHILLIRMSRERFPYRTAEITSPVAGKLAFLPVLDIEEISVFSAARAAPPANRAERPAANASSKAVPFFLIISKTLMFIGTVIYNQVHKDIHIPFLCFFDELFHIFHGAEGRVNTVIV